ncbi:transporter substrate-binding domain-containing protein (plasmid) [Klebsiella variicola]|uniref:response regulator n=1 Tax=Klebsiella variicola TaxID=244366 RepID=UPI002166DE87|nr:transporter substrate-binding domain-containing protein [Klebsiella variicola]UVW55895.1 transporter substrate-binding domain-containing protein [Klebsiella variicola]
MNFFNTFFTFVMITFSTYSYALSGYTDYEVQCISGSVELDDMRLTDHELRWLNSKKNFIVAVDKTMHSALLETVPGQRAKGINADYLGLLQQNLKVNVTVREYARTEDAVSALKAGEVDAMLTDLLNRHYKDAALNTSLPLITSYTVLVTTVDNTMLPLSTTQPVKIARVNDYPAIEVITRSFPNATVVDYPDYYKALSSVSSGDNQYFIGSNVITSTLISRYFTHALNAIKYDNSASQRNFFLTRKETPVMNNTLNHFIDSLTNEARRDVIQNWLNTGNLGFVNHPLTLTNQEQNWLNHHPEVKVLTTSFHPPLSMTDENGDPRGMMGDLLNIISLQTGIHFVPVTAPIPPPGDNLHPKGEWDIFPGAIYTEKREHQVAFSNTLMVSPYVYVMRKERARDQAIIPGMKVGLPSYYGLDEILKKRHPQVKWIAVDNASAAFNQLQDGTLDALVAIQPTARFMVDHYYPDTQDFFRINDVPGAAIAFALPRGEPELKSIINKALDNLPPSEILRLTEKWTKMPKVTIDTWDLYSKQFYIFTALALALVVSSLLWGFYLLREVQRRKVVQGRLENQISFRRALSDSLPAPSYVVNAEGKIISYNRAFVQYFTEAYLGNAMLPLTDPQSPFAAIMPDFANMALDDQGNRPVKTSELDISNGCATRNIQHWLTLCDRPANADQIFICGWEDITETRSLIHELEVEKNKAITATVAKSQFLASMSHEIRTPVSSIMGFLELLSTPQQTEAQKAEAIALAYSTGQSLLGLIGDVLDVDKIESGKYQLQPEWLDMSVHLTTIYQPFHTLAARKKIQMVLNNTLSPNCLVMIDPQAIKQVLTNLLSNALKFTQQGSIRLTAMLVAEGNTQARLLIDVADSGSGISDEEQRLLFEPYSQTRSGRQHTGSGLGLMICRQLVSNMRGEISVKSSPGVGSTFSVSIPVPVMACQGEVVKPCQVSHPLPKNLQVLIADDHPTNRLLLKRQLSTLGYEVSEACDGEEALKHLANRHFDLLITDVNMPHLDGFGLIQAVRDQNMPLTIWGLTANAQSHERERGLRHGMDLCLFKPLTLEILKTHLSRLSSPDESISAPRWLDIRVLKENTDNDPELMREIVQTFSQESREDFAQAQQALKEGNWLAFRKHIHRLHGSAGILSLTRLKALCFELESQPFNDNELPTHAPLMQVLAEHLAELEHEFALWLRP